MSIGRKAAVSGLWMTAATVTGQLVFFVVFVVLARLLEKDEFGLIAYAAIFTNFFGLFMRLGYGDALVQLRRMSASHVATAYWASTGAGIAMSALCAAAAYPLASFLDKPELGPVLAVMSLSSVLISSRTIPSRLLQRALRFRDLALCQTAGNVLGGVAGVTCALQGAGVWSLVAHRLVTEAVSTVAMHVAAAWRPIYAMSWRRLVQLTGFSNQVFAANIIDFADQYLDQLLVGSFLGDTRLGEYSVSRRLLRTLTQVLLGSFRPVSFSAFAKLQDNPRAMAAAVYRSSTLVALVGFPVFLGIAAFAPQAIEATVGEKWKNVAPLTQAFCFQALYSTSMVTFAGACRGSGNPGFFTRNRIVAVVLNVVVFLIAVPYGLLAVAIGVVARTLLQHPYQIWLLRRATTIRYSRFYASLAGPALAASAAVGFSWGVVWLLASETPAVVQLLIAAVLITLAMATIVRFAMPETWASLRTLRRQRDGEPTTA